MVIAIDCRMINSSGIGVYLRGILPIMLKSEHEFLLVGNRGNLSSFAKNKNVKIITCNISPFSVKELLVFPLKITREINKTAVYYSPYFNIPCGITVPVFTTIHDIIFPDIPEMTSKTGLAARMFLYRRAYKKSYALFTVSEFSKTRIEANLGTAKPVIVTHSGIQPMFPEYRNKRHNINKKKTIVFIGNIKKHKGLELLIDAFQLAKKEGLPHQLVIMGEKDNFRSADRAVLQKIENPEAKSISFTGFISDKQLMEYLSQASLLVQPSFYEGFGLPPLEAMTLGTKALVSDIPVFREIYSDFPVSFFRSGDCIDLKNKMTELLLNQPVPVITLPQRLLKRYTFEKTTALIMHNLLTINQKLQ